MKISIQSRTLGRKLNCLIGFNDMRMAKVHRTHEYDSSQINRRDYSIMTNYMFDGLPPAPGFSLTILQKPIRPRFQRLSM